jgi:hypothetical protein
MTRRGLLTVLASTCCGVVAERATHLARHAPPLPVLPCPAPTPAQATRPQLTLTGAPAALQADAIRQVQAAPRWYWFTADGVKVYDH